VLQLTEDGVIACKYEPEVQGMYWVQPREYRITCRLNYLDSGQYHNVITNLLRLFCLSATHLTVDELSRLRRERFVEAAARDARSEIHPGNLLQSHLNYQTTITVQNDRNCGTYFLRRLNLNNPITVQNDRSFVPISI
jgi:hypothetical protein